MIKKFHHVEFDKGKIIDLSADTTDHGRFYHIPTENGMISYPSVTTVTGWEKREMFTEWRKRNLHESARTLDRGNIIHDRIEKFLYNDPTWKNDVQMEYKSLLGLMESTLRRIDNIYGLELPLYSHTLKMAGRADCIAEFDGELSIIDFKGSTKNKKKEWIENYFQQGACYSIMFQELTGIKISQIVIIIGTEQGICQTYIVDVMDYVKGLVDVRTKYFKENEGVLSEKVNL